MDPDIGAPSRRRVLRRPLANAPAATPATRDLVLWAIAAAPHLVPPNDFASRFGPGVTILCADPASTGFFGDTDLTVAVWVRPTDVAASSVQYPYTQWNLNGTERKFLFFNDSASDCVGFRVSKAGQPAGIDTRGGIGALREGQWYRLVGVHRRGVEIAFYVNGQLVGTMPWTVGIETGEGPLPQQPWLGGLSRGATNYDTTSYWRGLIGPVCYYERAWSSAEVEWDYDGGHGRRYADGLQPTPAGVRPLDGLVAFWEMTEEDHGVGPYVVRRDAHSGGHHWAQLQYTRPVSDIGILARTTPIGDGQRARGLRDQSALANQLVEPGESAGPFWDDEYEVLGIEDGRFGTRPGGLTGLDGRELSLFLVSILQHGTAAEPWLRLSDRGEDHTGLEIFRDGAALMVQAWIGGGAQRLRYELSLPAERLIEVHYGSGRLSLFENGALKDATVAPGGFDHPVNTLSLGPGQGFKELLLYNRVHK